MKMLKKMMSWALALVLVLSAVCGGISVAHAAQADLDLKVEKTDDNKVKVSIVAKGDTTVAAIGGWLDFDKEAFTRTGKSSPKLDSTVVASNPESAHPDLMMFSAEPKIIEDEEGNATMPIPEFADGEAIIVFTFTPTDKYDETKDYNFKLIIDELRDKDGVDHPVADITKTLKGEAPAPAVHTVKFVSNGEVLNTVEVNDGETVAKPADPTREGYTFKGWKLNGADYDFSAPVTEDLTLVAEWEVIPGEIDKDVDLSQVKITKKVTTVPEGMDYEQTTFTFEFEGVKVEGNNNQVAVADMPVLGPVTITMPGENATVALGTVEFPMGGVYTYKITEVTPDPVPEGWTYDDTVYYLVLEVEEKDGKLELNSFFIHKDSETGEKGDAVFENTYAPTTDLTITKTVAATDPNPAEQGKKFDFTITFDKDFVGTINGAEVQFTAGVPYEFQLADGESLKIEGIPAGTAYTLTEAGAEYYTATATVYENDTKKTEKPGEYGAGVTVGGTAVAADTGKNKVDVVNTYSITPPTGVVIHGEMIGIAILVLVAMAGSFILSRKLRRA